MTATHIHDARAGFLDDAAARGLVQACTDEAGLAAALAGGPVAGYAGFDATADCLHVGHLLPLMLLRRFQRAGHRPIVLLGGGTTRIGDPSFRDAGRPMLDADGIARNVAGIRRVVARFLAFDGPDGAVMVDNAEWLDPLRFIDFLREVGRHFTVSRMLTFDSVRNRLDAGEGLTLMEFNYMVLQAFDFLHLSRERGCLLQLGGSDQWGNIVNGIELARRVDRRQLFGLTAPLLATASGTKMGKTADGAVWLDPDRLGSFELWQWWRNVDDRDAGRFLPMFTDLPLDECRRLAALRGSEANAAKEALADGAVAIAHGADGLARARAGRAAAFGADEAGLPEHAVPPGTDGTVPVAEVLVHCGLASSRNEARRLIRDGGARLDGTVVTDPLATLANERIAAGVRVSAGRKRHARTRIGA